MTLQIRGTLDVAVRRVERIAPQLLQVRGLGVDEQLVHGRNLDVFDQPEIDPHANAGKQLHGLFAADRLHIFHGDYDGARHCCFDCHLAVGHRSDGTGQPVPVCQMDLTPQCRH